MAGNECVAMILAGGQGSRLGSLTRRLAKPAVPFGGKYRIIDFSLSNCSNSGIGRVGIVTQYQPLALHRYIGSGAPWHLDGRDGGVFLLPPCAREKGAEWYKGTADAIYQNFDVLEMLNPQYVLVLAGDHIYTMDYSLMLRQHKSSSAEATVAVCEVPRSEASRFGIVAADRDGNITSFAEKPAEPLGCLASMGVYIFNWPLLKAALEYDQRKEDSCHDFGRDIIPQLLAAGRKLRSYRFSGYWKDVGTVESFWEANMDMLAERPPLDLYNPNWRIYSRPLHLPPPYASSTAEISCSILSEGCCIRGKVSGSVIFPGAQIGEGASVKNSIIMPYAQIGSGAQLSHVVAGGGAMVEPGTVCGGKGRGITVLEAAISAGMGQRQVG